MKVDITLKMEYKGAPDLDTEHTITTEIHPGISVTQNSLNVADEISHYIEKEIFNTLDTIIRRS